MKFDELYKKVIDSLRAFEERRVPIHLDFKIEDLRDALIESNETIGKLVGAKKSAEQILQNLLYCGLIKEWYFNGKFNVVLKADDPHLQIAELKKKLMPCLNGDCILTCEVVEKYGKENAELKKKLENVQASMYCDVVDAGMENRKLKRALWIARAENAKNSAFICWNRTESGWQSKYEKWKKVERKCLKKAEEYK